MNSSIYLDYNSTSPLDKSVKAFLQEGKFLFGNPSSAHRLGQEARKELTESINQIKNTFNLDHSQFDLYFHSGASESIANFFYSVSSDDTAIGFYSDHNAVKESIKKLSLQGIETYLLKPLSDGGFPLSELEEIISKTKKRIFLNFTHVNNESGVIWPLSILEKIKSEQVFIHVDNVQSVGKIKNWNELSNQADFYSYSAHKFGALKGLGFSFVSKKFPFNSMIDGGSQQEYRSGTLNELGTKTIALALATKKRCDSFDEMSTFKKSCEEILKENNDILIVGEKQDRSNNTIQFIHKKQKADAMLIHFDLNGLCVSSGSACNSGSLKESEYLNSLGLEEFSKNSIRMSFGEDNLGQKEEIKIRLKQVLLKL